MPLRRDLEVREAPAEAEEWATSANAPSRNAGPPCNEWVEHSARSKSPYYFSSSHSFLQLLAIIFFSSLSFHSFHLFVNFFFFLSRQFVHAQGSSWFSFAHPINLFFSFLLFFPYTRVIIIIIKSPARYIDCVYAIVSFLAKSFVTIIRTNRSFLFFSFPPLFLLLFFFLRLDSPTLEKQTNRGIRGLALFFFTPPPPFHFFARYTYRSSSMLYVRVCASSLADIYLLIYSLIHYIFLILRNRFNAKNRSYER